MSTLSDQFRSQAREHEATGRTGLAARNREIADEIEAMEVTLHDQITMAALTGLLSQNGHLSPKEAADAALAHADATIIARGIRRILNRAAEARATLTEPGAETK